MSNTKKGLLNARSVLQKPLPLETSIPDVQKLTRDMLPASISDFVFDVAERSQCPPEFVAVAALASLSSLIGGKCILFPKQKDNWAIRPNLWVVLIGPPSAMKSPAMKEPVNLISLLEKREIDANAETRKKQDILAKLQSKAFKQKEKEANELYAEGKVDEALKLMAELETNPASDKSFRIIVNDATVEKLGELFSDNPNGLFLVRDELIGWISKLVREDHQSERAFILECFDGFDSFTYDRIGRGTIVIERCILSILGSIQPSKLTPIIRAAITGKVDDGLIQRMQLAVWPDPVKGKKWKDQTPDPAAHEQFKSLIEKFHRLQRPVEGEIEFRFSPEAQLLFTEWWEKLQAEIECDDLHPVIQSHLAKAPKTIGSLAMLFQLCTDNHKQIEKPAIELALRWYDFLKSHAFRIYHSVDTARVDAAKRILNKKDSLSETFTIRDVRRKGWTGLTDNNSIEEALNVLIDHHHLIEIDVRSGSNGGRPTIGYRWNKVGPENATISSLVPPKPAKTEV